MNILLYQLFFFVNCSDIINSKKIDEDFPGPFMVAYRMSLMLMFIHSFCSVLQLRIIMNVAFFGMVVFSIDQF